MDPIKEGLITAVGDLTESERKVKQKVRANLNKKRLRIPKFVPMIAIAIIVFVVALTTIDHSRVQYDIPTTASFNDDYYDYLKEILNVENSSNTAEEYYLNELSVLAYANHKKIKIDTPELTKLIDKRIAEMEAGKIYQTLVESNYDMTKLKQLYFPHDITTEYLTSKLIDLYQVDYPSFREDILQQMIENDSLNYFAYHRQADFTKLSSYENLKSQINPDYEPIYALVIDVTDDAITVVKDGNYFELNGLSMEQIASFKEGVYKLPRTDKNLKVGDYVRVKFDANLTIDENIQQIYTPTFDKSIQSIDLDKEETTMFQALASTLNWTEYSGTSEYQFNLFLEDSSFYILSYDENNGLFAIYDTANDMTANLDAIQSAKFAELIKALY